MFRIVSCHGAGFALLMAVSVSAGPGQCRPSIARRKVGQKVRLLDRLRVAPGCQTVVACKTRGVPKGCGYAMTACGTFETCRCVGAMSEFGGKRKTYARTEFFSV